MGSNSKIEWTDHTFNPWIGCTKVSPACKNCYAERDMDHRYGKVAWGPDGTRVKTSDDNWRNPIKWDREAAESGVRKRVFCASLADVFEDWQGPILDHKGKQIWVNESGLWVTDDGMQGFAYRKRHVTMDDVRSELFRLIDSTPNLDWLLLTKRPENIRPMILDLKGFRLPPNIWLGTSVETQEYADKRIPKLLKCRDLSPVLFLSCEPLLGELDLGGFFSDIPSCDFDPGIDWVIAGGESGPNARPSHPDWFRSLRDQCNSAGVPFFFKQWGEIVQSLEPVQCRNRSTGNFETIPAGEAFVRIGKKAAGRELDGHEWNEFPEVAK